MKKLKNVEEPVENFFKKVRLLGNHLGPILYKLPPNWRKDDERLKAFVQILPDDLSHAFEFRDKSWFDDKILEILDRNGCAFCVYTVPGFSSPKWISGKFVYCRFHGSVGKILRPLLREQPETLGALDALLRRQRL